MQRDIANVKAGAKAAGIAPDNVFLPATAPSGVGTNACYKNEEEYFHALGAELNKEYKAIVDTGLILRIDDPFLPDVFVEPRLDDRQKKRRAEIYVEAANAALKGIPAERVRYHTCYGAYPRGGTVTDHPVYPEGARPPIQLRVRQPST